MYLAWLFVSLPHLFAQYSIRVVSCCESLMHSLSSSCELWVATARYFVTDNGEYISSCGTLGVKTLLAFRVVDLVVVKAKVMCNLVPQRLVYMFAQ